MSTRRVVIGKQGDGTFGLRIALPGFDALTDDANDSNKFSFNSDWADLVKVHAIGTFTLSSSSSTVPVTVVIPTLSYIPTMDIRLISGNTVYDDHMVIDTPLGSTTPRSTAVVGAPSTSDFQAFHPRALQGSTALYVVYKVPMP
jgi:hypothetical protein